MCDGVSVCMCVCVCVCIGTFLNIYRYMCRYSKLVFSSLYPMWRWIMSLYCLHASEYAFICVLKMVWVLACMVGASQWFNTDLMQWYMHVFCTYMDVWVNAFFSLVRYVYTFTVHSAVHCSAYKPVVYTMYPTLPQPLAECAEFAVWYTCYKGTKCIAPRDRMLEGRTKMQSEALVSQRTRWMADTDQIYWACGRSRMAIDVVVGQ